MNESKYHDVLICQGCKEIYIDSDGGCSNYCVECENCDTMTQHSELDETLLLELKMEVCKACSIVWRKRFPVSSTKYPSRETLGLRPHISDMGDHKGRYGCDV